MLLKYIKCIMPFLKKTGPYTIKCEFQKVIRLRQKEDIMIISGYKLKACELGSNLIEGLITDEEFNTRFEELTQELIDARMAFKIEEKSKIISELIIAVLTCTDLFKIDKEMFMASLTPSSPYCHPPTNENIIDAITKYFNINPASIFIPSKEANVIQARAVCMYFMHTDMEKSNKEIAEEFGTSEKKVSETIKQMRSFQQMNAPVFDKIRDLNRILYPKISKVVNIYDN